MFIHKSINSKKQQPLSKGCQAVAVFNAIATTLVLSIGYGVGVTIPVSAQTTCTTSPCTGNTAVDADTSDYFSDSSRNHWTFQDTSSLNAIASNAITGGEQIFFGVSALNASAVDAIGGGSQYFNGTSALNASSAYVIGGGTQSFYDTSVLNASAANGVSDGAQYFNNNSILNAMVSGAVSGGTQFFYNMSALNASVANAVDGGTQRFYDVGVLNASAAGAVGEGTQYFSGNSGLKASATSAVIGGTQIFFDTSALNASMAGAVNGGSQYFNDDSRLNATATDAVTGGIQSFYGASVLDIAATRAVRGGSQYFNNSSQLNAAAVNGIGGGAQYFYNTSALNASALNAVSAGMQDFHDGSVLNVSVASGVSGGVQTFHGNSMLNVLADDALTQAVTINFDNQGGGAGGTLTLNGHGTVVGVINSIEAGAGVIENGAVSNSVLTVDGSILGASSFSGVIQDGGSGRLGLELRGGTLTLGGINSYSGGTTIAGGTLQVSSDSNLGDASGNLILNGGTLATTGSFQTSRAVALAQTGIFDVSADARLILAGTVSGPGDLVKTGAGVLQLTNSGNAYRGTIVEAGGLIGNSTSIAGNIANAGSVTFDQAADGSFVGDIAGLGGTSGTMIKQGAGNLLLNGTSSLNWVVQDGNLTTAAERFSGNAAIASSASLTFDQTLNSSYSGTLTGTGAFVKAGAGTLSYNGDSASFTGTTAVSAGALIVGSDVAHSGALLGGSFSVADGALLGGYGAIGSGNGSSVTVASGGILSSGNSVGTLTVNGDVIFEKGSIYAVDIAGAGRSDLTKISGSTDILGGVVRVTALDPQTSYRNGQTYTILTSDGGITGTFENTVSKSAFLTASETYGTNAVNLTVSIRNSQANGGGTDPRSGTPVPAIFETVSETKNQIATAKALDTLDQSGPSLALYNKLLMLSADEARNAYDLLSGEAYASAKTALIEGSVFIRDAMNSRLRSVEASGEGAPVAILSYGPEATRSAAATETFGAIKSAPRPEDYDAWVQGYGVWGSAGGDGNAAKLTDDTGGFVAGIDGTVFDDWRLGILAGYSRTTFHLDDRSSAGQSDNYTLGAYAGADWKLANGHALAFRSGLAYMWHSIDMDRSVYFSGFSDSLNSDYNAGTFQAYGELAYQWGNDDTSFEAFANLAYVHLHTDGFNERGRTAAALSVDSDTMNTAFTTVGLRASRNFMLGRVSANAHGSAGWRHAYGDIETSSRNGFIGSSAFTIYGAPIMKDAAIIEAGLDFNLSPRATLGVNYTGQIGSHAYQQGFNAVFKVRF